MTMTPEKMASEINTFVTALQNEVKKRGYAVQIQVQQIDQNEFYIIMIDINQMIQKGYTIWFVDNKAEYCEGRLNRHPPKDIN